MTSALEAAERRRRELASAGKRLRVAVMTDSPRAAELADTLLELVENRLLAWAFAEAAADAPESVVQAARILAAGGPVGPYANAADAGRYYAASVQLAAVQAGVGQPQAAGRTLDALEEWRRQLGRLPVLEQLSQVTAVWALLTRARAWLATGEVALANAAAEAALLRLYAAEFESQPSLACLTIAAHLAAADALWAAGHPERSLAHHRLAVDRHRALCAEASGDLRPAVRLVLRSPLAALYESFAQRQEAIGESAAAIAAGRDWLALERRFADGDAPGGTAARTALGQALARAGRRLEAAELADPAEWTDLAVAVPPEQVWWQPPPDHAFAVAGLSATAPVRLQRDEEAAIAAGKAARAAAESDEARRRREAEQAAAAAAAVRAEAERRASVEAELAAREAAERKRERAAETAARRAAAAEAERAASEARRQELAAARARARAVAPEAVEVSLVELEDARARLAAAGDELVALAAAQERLAAVLRPLALADPAQYRDEHAATLEALVSLRWRLGDAEGSREAARHLKAL